MEKTFTIQTRLNSCAIRDTYLLLQSRFGIAVKMENGNIMRHASGGNFQPVNVSERVCMYCRVKQFLLAVYCGKPDDPLHGYHKSNNYTFETEVEYACYYGFALRGERKTWCQSTGNWDLQSPPTCEGMQSCSRVIATVTGKF